MHVTITIDTAQDLTAQDLAVLLALAHHESSPAAVPETKAVEPEPRRRGRPPKATATPAPEIEPEDDDSPLIAEVVPVTDLIDDDGPTLADAISAATSLIASGKGAKVKAALDAVGAPKVASLSVADVPAFLAKLA